MAVQRKLPIGEYYPLALRLAEEGMSIPATFNEKMSFPAPLEENPLVSIGMPVYNAEASLMRALELLLRQEYGHFELLIQDNASSDKTEEICRRYADSDERIRYRRNKNNLGPIPNFNRVFERASGDYFMWASHDDLWEPGYLKACLNGFAVSKSIVLVGTACETIDADTGSHVFIDEGFSTIGLPAALRYRHYKSIIHAGKHIGSIFYGLHKRSSLQKTMPLKNMIANDHLLLAQLCFEGEFLTLKQKLMAKQKGEGISKSFPNIAKALGIRNPFFIKCYYFVREIYLQGMIIQEKNLTLVDKFSLGAWSWAHFAKISWFPRIWCLLPGYLRQSLKRSFVRLVTRPEERALKMREGRIAQYKAGGQKPWSAGYTEYKEGFMRAVLQDPSLKETFVDKKPLPDLFGMGLDERVVEYPWLFSRLTDRRAFLLDAGSVMNYPYCLDSPELKQKEIVIFTLAPEHRVTGVNVSYMYGDLRRTEFKNGFFDEIVCLSTLEHVGMDNALLYTKDLRFKEERLNDYLPVIDELKRILKPQGRLFITVPFGRFENLGWMQQFDGEMVEKLIRQFAGRSVDATYFKYSKDGWQVSDQKACGQCVYFDVHKGGAFDPDNAAAARAVACLTFEK